MREATTHVLLPLVLTALLASPAAAAVSQEEVEGWQAELAEIDQALRGGDWRLAGPAAEDLVARMVASEPDARLAGLVSVALLSRALAEAGTGATDDALWHWIAAQNLNPKLRLARFPAYGEPGSFLEEHRLREAGAPPPGISPRPLGAGVAPPALGADGAVPEAWARFEVVVDAEGAVHAPVAVAPAGPVATIEALEALRRAKLAPAEADGRAVAVYWRPRPALWFLSRAGLPAGAGTELRGDPNEALAESLAACTDLGVVMETSGVGVGPGSVDVLKAKAARKGADALVLESYDASTVKGSAFRCGREWYPPHLRPRQGRPPAGTSSG